MEINDLLEKLVQTFEGLGVDYIVTGAVAST